MVDKLYEEATDINAGLTMLAFRVNVANSNTIDKLEEELSHLIVRQVNLELNCLKNDLIS